MSKRVLLFAPAAFNLAETSRMVEIAKAVVRHPDVSKVFEVHFISDGGDFEALIERHGFALTRMEPRLTKEKIEHIARVDRGEKFAPAFTDAEMIARVDHEVLRLRELQPVAVITGSYVTIPITCRVLHVPLIWVIQSTWLEGFFRHGAGVTDGLRPILLKDLTDWLVWLFINFWIRYGFLNCVNRAARHYGVLSYRSIFDFWRGDMTLVAEPPEFSGATLPPNHFFTGPLIPREEFPLPPEVQQIPRDKPLIYFAMGSSGTPEIVARILESFEGKPYRVVAPIKFQIAQLAGVRVPANVLVTDWLPALEVNRMADLAVIHGGIGTVLTAALAGKPVVGVGMQMEQVANLACLQRLGFAIRIPKSRDPSCGIQAAIPRLLRDETAKAKATAFAQLIAPWDGPRLAAERLLQRYGDATGASYEGKAEKRELPAFGDGVWIIDGPTVRDCGITWSTRMTVVKLRDGSLWISSPVSVPADTLGTITALGPVKYLVAGTPRHVWRLELWHLLFPNAQLWAARPTLMTLQKGALPFTGILMDEPNPAWAQDLDQLAFKGNPLAEEIFFFHRKSRTLIVDDLIVNIPIMKGMPLRNLFFKLAGVAYPHGGVPLDARLTFVNRKLARRSLAKLLSWDFDKLILAHGVCVEKDAKSYVERAFRWLMK